MGRALGIGEEAEEHVAAGLQGPGDGDGLAGRQSWHPGHILSPFRGLLSGLDHGLYIRFGLALLDPREGELVRIPAGVRELHLHDPPGHLPGNVERVLRSRHVHGCGGLWRLGRPR